ncbi:peroxiredoxin [Mucilaginibacter gilvus]|uniref:thioredoxin-dependent peroxiredoxin n=1 Tax=Mucilaginibacter gilvus TaxID=2305909 RepID=A0A3S3VFS1_9SPHI|nr:peroxiredoxin [Mucilaginibacter gilvus]RWY52524.1 peroxiredoxin [Mucilaginibacter gilvus]
MNIPHLKNFLAAAVLCLGLTIPAQAQKHLEKGDKMPSFSLTDQNGKTFNVTNEVGKHKLVIYFYPKDESMVCTKEACAFRDMFDQFAKVGAVVIGVNGGTVASHKAFANHYKLPFVLLSDPGDKVYKLFGVKKKFFMSGRETFVVDLNGTIVYSHAAMLEGKAHADDALAALKSAK